MFTSSAFLSAIRMCEKSFVCDVYRTQNDLPTENRQITMFRAPVISIRRPIQAPTSIYYSQTPYTIPRGLPRNGNSLSNFVLTHYRPYRRRSDLIAHPYVRT